MRYAIIIAIILLAAIFTIALFGNNIKAYLIKDVLQKELCEINGQICTCYSQECVCGTEIVPRERCINRARA